MKPRYLLSNSAAWERLGACQTDHHRTRQVMVMHSSGSAEWNHPLSASQLARERSWQGRLDEKAAHAISWPFASSPTTAFLMTF